MGEINARGGRNGKKNHIDTGVKTYIQHSQRLCSVYLYTRALEKQLSDAKTRACVATDPSPGQSLDVQVKICSYNVLCACDRIDCSDKVWSITLCYVMKQAGKVGKISGRLNWSLLKSY